MILAVLLLLIPSVAFGAVDLSRYRTATYGSPTHYCDPTRSLASSGSGTSGDPWNMSQCATQPVAGNVVGVLSIGNGVNPGVPVSMSPSGSYNIPAFNPTNAGTAGNPIVYVAEYPAISLSHATIKSNNNRTELRHSGTDDAACAVGTGGPMFGSYLKDYITLDGFYVDMAHVGHRNDGGVMMIWHANNVTVKNFVIDGKTTDCESNCTMLRTEATDNMVITNFALYDYANPLNGCLTSQRGEASMHYAAHNYEISHFLIDNTERGIFPKGSVDNSHNYGVIKYGIIRNVISCLSFNDFHDTNLTTLQNVLCHDWEQYGIHINPLGTDPRNFLLDHVTVADGSCPDINCFGPLYIVQGASATNVTITNSIWDWVSGTWGFGVEAEGYHGTYPTANYNGYYRAGNALRWKYDTSTSRTPLSAWQTATGQEANSQTLSSDPFTTRASNVFTIAGGHAALTASSTGGEIGAYGGLGSTVLGPDTTDSGGTSTQSTGVSGAVRLFGTVRIY